MDEGCGGDQRIAQTHLALLAQQNSLFQHRLIEW